MRVTTGLAAVALLGGLAAAQDGRGGASAPGGSIEDVLERRPGAADLVLESRERGAREPVPTTAFVPSPSLPDLVLHSDAIVHVRGLLRHGDWLGMTVAGHLWGSGPDELFVLNRAIAPGLADAAGDAEWVLFLGVTPQGLAAIGAIDAGVVPLAVDGSRPPGWPAAVPVPYGPTLGWVERLLECRADDGGARLAALLAGTCRAPRSADEALVALQVAALLAREPDLGGRAGALRTAAVHLPEMARAPAPGADPLPEGPAWALSLPAVAPHAPPACVLAELLRGREPRVHPRFEPAPREWIAIVAVARSAAARLEEPQELPPDADAATLRTWMLANWRGLLLQDRDFVETCLTTGAPDDRQAASACVRRLTGWPVPAVDGAPDEEFVDLLARFRDWCAASTGP
jgi:hypothetical protein